MSWSLGGHRSRFAIGVAFALGALLFGALLVGQGQARAAQDCTPGAPGVGDVDYPTYGNGGYDVRHYGLDIAYEPATDHVDGKAAIRATATQSLCSFNLDFVGMQLHSVEVNGKPAQWTRDEHELTVTPNQPLKDDRPFDVVARYDGVPVEFAIPGTTIRTGFMATPEGATVAGQPEVSAGWYPVNDHPLDKASYSFDVTVPNGFEVAANGFLRDKDSHKDTTTWEWEADEPMASYLATIDIADWDVHTWQTDTGLPVYDAVDKNITGPLREEIDRALGLQDEALDLLSDNFGPYPFDTVGAIVPNQEDLRFALETQTRPVYSKRFWRDAQGNPRNADFVIVHELAHQWYGDDVALGRWQDIWLNEGFATYAEWLWEEREGRATPQEIFQATYDDIPDDNAFWSVVIGNPGVDLLFDDAVYVRGAMTLQALRNEVGDDAFFEILQTWAASKSGGNGITEQFTALAEEISGQQLDDLFDLWLFTDTKPPPEAVSGGSAARSISSGARAQGESWLDDAQRRLRQGAY
jgi:aminopeptidase N